MKKFICFFIFICFFNINFVFALDIDKAYDYTYEEVNVDLASKYVILYNLNDNYKLLDIKSNEKVSIASLTKIMTTIVAIENISNLDDKVTITREVFNGISEYTKAGFDIGDKVTYRDLLYGAMLPSGADAVNALVLNISGSLDKFVGLMNDKVKELKLENTHFDNAIGMDSKDNYSSAYDLAIILNYALGNNTFKEVFTSKKYTCSNGLVLDSTLSTYARGINVDMIKGSKSGFTDGAGVCLASYANVSDVNYLLIVLGANSNKKSNAVSDSVDIYNYIEKNYGYKVLLDKDKVIKSLDVIWGNKKRYDVKVNEDVSEYVKNTVSLDDVKYEYSGIDKIKYGIKKGDKLGTVSIIYKDSVIGNSSLYLNSDIKFYHPVIYSIMFISFVVMIISFVKIVKNKKRKKKKRKKSR